MSELKPNTRKEDSLGTDHGVWDPSTGELRGNFPKPPVEHRDQPSILDRTRLALRTRTGQVIAGLTLSGLVAGGLGVAHELNGSSEKAPAKSDKNTSAPAQTGEVVKDNTDKEAAAPEFGLSAEQYEGNYEALAKEYYKQHNALLIAGIDKSNVTSQDRLWKDKKNGVSQNDEDYIFSIANPIMDKYVDALFVPNYEDDPALADYVQTLREIAFDTKLARIKTYSSEDKEPYVRALQTDEIAGSNDPLTTSVTWFDSDNRTENHAADLFTDTSVDPNTQTGGETFTWVKVGDQLKISGITHFDGTEPLGD